MQLEYKIFTHYNLHILGPLNTFMLQYNKIRSYTWKTLGHNGKAHPSSSLENINRVVHTLHGIVFMIPNQGLLLPHMCNLDMKQGKTTR